MIFDLVPPHWRRGPVVAAILRAAAELGTLAVVRPEGIPAGLALEQEHIIPLLETAAGPDLPAVMAMIPDGDAGGRDPSGAESREPGTGRGDPHARIPTCGPTDCRTGPRRGGGASPGVRQPRARECRRRGAPQGGEETASGQQAAAPRHMRDVLREVHRALVKAGIRDEVTLIASGGIALPEHMAKAIICGADLVAIDIPLVVALECRLCGECEHGEACARSPWSGCDARIRHAPDRESDRGMAPQLIEVLGAMGIREVRRLRGETGRAMFFEDLERDTSADCSANAKRSGAAGQVSTRARFNGRSPNADEFAYDPTTPRWSAQVRPAPPRYRNEIGKYSIHRASTLRSPAGIASERLPRRRALAAGRLPATAAAVRLPLHRAGVRRSPITIAWMPAREGAVAGGQSGLRDPGRLPLDAATCW